LFDLAYLKQRLLDYKGALDLYLQLNKIKPNDILLLNNLGVLYNDTKRYEDAEAAFVKIMLITKKWENAYRRLFGIYRYHLTDKQYKIEPLLLTGLKYNPEYEGNFLGMLAVYYDEVAKDRDKTIEYMTRLLEVDPSNEGALIRLQELKAESK